MTHPRIGVFGALVAVGGVLAWRWAQQRRVSQARLSGELSRWEAEGGALAPLAQTSPLAAGAHVAPREAGLPNGAAGPAHVGGTRDAWHFPHG